MMQKTESEEHRHVMKNTTRHGRPTCTWHMPSTSFRMEATPTRRLTTKHSVSGPRCLQYLLMRTSGTTRHMTKGERNKERKKERPRVEAPFRPPPAERAKGRAKGAHDMAECPPTRALTLRAEGRQRRRTCRRRRTGFGS